MARVVKNPFGELSGKVGTVVFKKGKNGAYIASLPDVSKHKPSMRQKMQRLKMSTVMAFLQPLQLLLKQTYFPFESQKSGFHAAKSYYLKEVVVFANDTYEIDYSKALVSFGDLRPIADLQLIPDAATHSVTVNWTNNSGQAMAHPDDVLLLVYYAPEKNKLSYRTHVALRADGTAVLQLDSHWAQQSLHIWAGFYRPSEGRAAMSCYGGSVAV